MKESLIKKRQKEEESIRDLKLSSLECIKKIKEIKTKNELEVLKYHMEVNVSLFLNDIIMFIFRQSSIIFIKWMKNKKRKKKKRY